MITEKKKGQKPLRGKYAGNLEIILYKFLLSQEHSSDEGVCSQTQQDWFKALGLCSIDYNDREYIDRMFDTAVVDFGKSEVYDFIYKQNNRMKNLLLSVFDKIRAMRLLDYNMCYALQLEDGSERLVTEEEANSIREAELDALESLRFKSMYQVRCAGCYDIFYASVRKRLSSGEYLGDFSEMKSYYRIIQVRYSYSRIMKRLNSLVDDEKNILDVIKENNRLFTESLINSTNRKQAKHYFGYEYTFIEELIRLKDDEIPNTCNEFFDDRRKSIK